MQCQEFEPRGAGDIFGHGAACCRALPSFTAGYMLYFSRMSGQVAHCPTAISLDLFKSDSARVEHGTHNLLRFILCSSEVKKRNNGSLGFHPKQKDMETFTQVPQHMFEVLVLSTFPSSHFRETFYSTAFIPQPYFCFGNNIFDLSFSSQPSLFTQHLYL